MVKVIAELCQNHNGSLDVIEKMIKEAAKAGASFVKFQIIFSEDLTCRSRFDSGHTEENGVEKTIRRPYVPEIERLSKLDFTEDDYKRIVEICRENNITPIPTIFARKRIELVKRLGLSEIVKIASPDIISHKMIRELCEVFDHLIISTGGATDEEIAAASEIVNKSGKKLTLLHCVSLYPNSLDICNLARLKFLGKFTKSVGWSDHTLTEKDGLIASKFAVGINGVEFIERHFTVLEKDESKDGPVSVNPIMLKELVDFINSNISAKIQDIRKYEHLLEIVLGTEKRDLTHREKLNIDYFRGRFASHNEDGDPVFNWEDKPIE